MSLPAPAMITVDEHVPQAPEVTKTSPSIAAATKSRPTSTFGLVWRGSQTITRATRGRRGK